MNPISFIPKSFVTLCIAVVLSCFSMAPSFAKSDAIISKPSSSDLSYFEKQRQSINKAAKEHLGRQLNQQLNNDLEILQALLDKQVVKKDQTQMLQAMGVVLGDLYIKQIGVHWVSYKDTQGRSRALQWTDSKHVLFPITMISRRVSAGVNVDVKALYVKGKKELQRVIKFETRRKALGIK